MSWLQCHVEWLQEAEQKGHDAFRRGEVIKSSPRFEDYKGKDDPFTFCSVNEYHTHWIMGWERAQQEAI